MCLVVTGKGWRISENNGSYIFWSPAKDGLNIFWHLAVAVTCG